MHWVLDQEIRNYERGIENCGIGFFFFLNLCFIISILGKKQETYVFFSLIQDDLENLPFPNDETEFNLPDEIFESNAKPHSSASESSAVADEGMTGKE